MAIKTLNDYNIANKKILVRADLNIPIENGKISDNSRLISAIPTIKTIKSLGGITILISHFGRPGGLYKEQLSLKQVIPELERLLNFPVKFSSELVGRNVLKKIDSLTSGEILLLENTRFFAEEEMNDESFSKELSRLGDIYCNDAFSAAHRAHASTVGVSKLLPNCAGHLMKKEIDTLENVLKQPQKPLTAVVGGAKISTKLNLLLNLIKKVDYLVIGGGMANTFLFAQGLQIGKSLCEKNLKETSQRIISEANENNCKIILPHDVVVASEFVSNANFSIKNVKDINSLDMILDIGPSTCDKINEIFSISKTLIWNGPMGAFELKPFDKGTINTSVYASKLTKNGKLISVAGGGDTVSALKKSRADKDFTYISLAGGAFLEWMEGKNLPGVECLL
tara:strand:+ start:214 stop:1401 length:1188 start_codon:yes stop_codon:yes gene_type:complete